jgi:hypothetical protein
MKNIKFALYISTGIFLTTTASAQTTTAFKSGESTTGMTKQCFYNAMGSSYTRTVSSTTLCPLSIQVSTGFQSQQPSYNSNSYQTPTITAFKSGENVTGLTKQCFYNGLGNTYTRTISSVSLCPLSIQVER